ncbi:MAG: DapH/DapD/GlmU-related protein [Candidatus Kuenenbacteria bacterium]
MKFFKKIIAKIIDIPENRFHPMVFINGKPKIGKNVCIGFFSEVNAKNARVIIGDNCDIASFVAINCADSHKRCLDKSDYIERGDITLENNVFVGSHSFIGGNVSIGHHSVVAAGTIITKPLSIPPYSLAIGNPCIIKEGHFKQ